MEKAVLVKALRTPVGKMKGTLSGFQAEDLAAIVVNEVVKDDRLDPAEIDGILFSNLFNYNIAGLARAVGLHSGIPYTVPGVTIEQQCASSLTGLAFSTMLINTGNADVLLVGGVESYSKQPFLIARPEVGFPESLQFIPYGIEYKGYGLTPMLQTAENVAKKYGISRKECDEFALRSHQLAAEAYRLRRFKDQIVPIDVPKKKGEALHFEVDECIRFDSSIESLSRLKPVWGSDGVCTAGNSSPRNDGASVMLVMSESRAKALGYESLCEVKAFCSVGVHPDYMGTGPIYATRKLLYRENLSVEDIDLFEINEAFAAQSIPCMRELGIDIEKLNVNGGAIAIGHPNAASGGILVARMAYEMKRRGAHRGLISFCVGGGQGVSLLLERNT
jgi:acetyl-CoA acetyltransferase family protein